MTQQRLSQLPEPLPVYQGEDLQSFIDRASRYAYLPPRVIWRMLGYRGAPHVRCRAVGDDFFALLGHLSHQAPSVLQERLTNWRHDSPSEERQGNPAVQHHQSITSGCPRCRIEADGARTEPLQGKDLVCIRHRVWATGQTGQPVTTDFVRSARRFRRLKRSHSAYVAQRAFEGAFQEIRDVALHYRTAPESPLVLLWERRSAATGREHPTVLEVCYPETVQLACAIKSPSAKSAIEAIGQPPDRATDQRLLGAAVRELSSRVLLFTSRPAPDDYGLIFNAVSTALSQAADEDRRGRLLEAAAAIRDSRPGWVPPREDVWHRNPTVGMAL